MLVKVILVNANVSTMEPHCVRMVNVPDAVVHKLFTIRDNERRQLSFLSEVFSFGQNDVLPIKGKRSVSVGDIIVDCSDLWQVGFAGFYKI